MPVGRCRKYDVACEGESCECDKIKPPYVVTKSEKNKHCAHYKKLIRKSCLNCGVQGISKCHQTAQCIVCTRNPLYRDMWQYREERKENVES